MIIVIDHHDSFVETLARYVREAGYDTVVISQDADLEDISCHDPEAIILSPGPGRPENTGVTNALLANCRDDLPILGVCLGHQTLAQYFGGTVTHAREPRHGKASSITHNGHAMFDGLEENFEAGRYHALIVDNLPEVLHVTARSARGEIMAFAHHNRPIYGMQFHPESILTPQGRQMINNFLTLADVRADRATA